MKSHARIMLNMAEQTQKGINKPYPAWSYLNKQKSVKPFAAAGILPLVSDQRAASSLNKKQTNPFNSNHHRFKSFLYPNAQAGSPNTQIPVRWDSPEKVNPSTRNHFSILRRISAKTIWVSLPGPAYSPGRLAVFWNPIYSVDGESSQHTKPQSWDSPEKGTNRNR